MTDQELLAKAMLKLRTGKASVLHRELVKRGVKVSATLVRYWVAQKTVVDISYWDALARIAGVPLEEVFASSNTALSAALRTSGAITEHRIAELEREVRELRVLISEISGKPADHNLRGRGHLRRSRCVPNRPVPA